MDSGVLTHRKTRRPVICEHELFELERVTPHDVLHYYLNITSKFICITIWFILISFRCCIV
jgi:hypothetical protein